MRVVDARWGLGLTGGHYELQILRAIIASRSDFALANVTTIAQTTETALFSSLLADVLDASAAHAVGDLLVDRLNGALLVRDPTREPLSVSCVLERAPSTTETTVLYRRHYRLRAEAAVIRIRIAGGLSGGPAVPSPEPQWVIDSFDDDTVADVLTYLRGAPDWFDLWKAFERMRADIQMRSDVPWRSAGVGWPTGSEMTVFKKSAQYFRHSVAKAPPGMTAANAMPLAEATAFVASLARQWLEWRSDRS